MQALIDRIRNEGQYLGGGILKVDSFLNHQLDPDLTLAMGEAFKQRFTAMGVHGVTKIVTAEVSGIAPAFAVGLTCQVPITYARKKRPITMPDGYFEAEAPSHTKGGVTRLLISPEFLSPKDRVLLIDDFLATGKTLEALVRIIQQSGADLLGIGCVIEKSFEGGRARLEPLGIPIVSLAIIESMDRETITVTSTDP
ncbi:MAG: xanthine phosphoribosyltransferase [Trueperaceae bacterium]|nr:MAG: xanthine phosphoribosyltransferase [Trueperaceae bacterium]